MPRSRPASNPLSFHKPTGQFYVTRGGKRIYLGADPDAALEEYHRLALGQFVPAKPRPLPENLISAKELANRFLTAQQANWRNPKTTLRGYREWLGRFLRDHPKLKSQDLTVERFASWKLSLRRRRYSARSINHYLSAVRAMYRFGEDTGLLERAPLLKRVKNESLTSLNSRQRQLHTQEEVQKLLACADSQLRLMLLLGLNCGFGPKDIRDLTWDDFGGDRVTLARSKRVWPFSLAPWKNSRHTSFAPGLDRADNPKHVQYAKHVQEDHPWTAKSCCIR